MNKPLKRTKAENDRDLAIQTTKAVWVAYFYSAFLREPRSTESQTKPLIRYIMDAYQDQYEDYSTSEFRDLVMDWSENGTKGLKEMSIKELLEEVYDVFCFEDKPHRKEEDVDSMRYYLRIERELLEMAKTGTWTQK